MWPLLLCSILAVTVVIERAILFSLCRRRATRSDKALEESFRLLAAGERKKAETTARTAGPIGEVIAESLASTDMELEDALEISGGQFLASLKRHLPLLDTIITLSPMLGILGTVTGIIGSFHLLDLTGTTDPSAVSSGIAEALITTAAGLTVAIAVLVPFNFFRSRLSDWSKRIDLAARRCLSAAAKGEAHEV